MMKYRILTKERREIPSFSIQYRYQFWPLWFTVEVLGCEGDAPKLFDTQQEARAWIARDRAWRTQEETPWEVVEEL